MTFSCYVFWRDIDVFGKKTVFLKHILYCLFLLIKVLIVFSVNVYIYIYIDIYIYISLCDGVTIVEVWIGNRIYWTLKQLVTTFYKSLSNTTGVLIHGLHCTAWQHVPTVHFPLLPGSHPRRLTAISHQPSTLLTAVSRSSLNNICYSL
jgi:hypothetical protein